MEQTPTDTPIRNLLDPVSPRELSDEFRFLLAQLADSGYLSQWYVLGRRLAFSLDGVYYFSSKKISCPQCQRHEHEQGTVYLHSAITPVVVAPGQPQVLPYVPEFIVPQDGTEKQDCERRQAVGAARKGCLTDKALSLNWCDLQITHEGTGEILYRNEWITSLALEEENTPEVVACGRARWKSENENNNVLKNHGYHLDHNLGHGQEYLSTTLLTLNLLAFLLHTIAQVADLVYQQVRRALGRRRTFFNDVEALMRYLIFSDWRSVPRFMFDQLELEPD